jgi:uncharacterized membrane protein
VEILLALGAAISYGASDFTGGFISKRAAVFLVVLVSQIVSLAVLLAVLPFWAGNYSREAIGWGATAGVAGVAGASALYRGLSVGRMSVVAPISGVLAAGIPVLVGLWLGERPGPLALIGVAVGLMAVVAVSRTPDPRVPAGSTSSEEHRGRTSSSEAIRIVTNPAPKNGAACPESSWYTPASARRPVARMKPPRRVATAAATRRLVADRSRAATAPRYSTSEVVAIIPTIPKSTKTQR